VLGTVDRKKKEIDERTERTAGVDIVPLCNMIGQALSVCGEDWHLCSS